MNPLHFLAEQAKQERVAITPELDEALAWLDTTMERLAGALEVEYIGPAVGMKNINAEHVYRLMVRQHTWDVFVKAWSLKVCDALDNAGNRMSWPVQGVQRLRKQHVVQVLPEFFAGYLVAIEAAGKADTEAAVEIRDMAGFFATKH